jgi:hypothetical protein
MLAGRRRIWPPFDSVGSSCAGLRYNPRLTCPEKSMAAELPNVDLSPLDRVPGGAWASLAGKRIYFGHHSVGCNIIEGMTEIIAVRPQIELAIFEAKSPDEIGDQGFAHSGVGANKDPDSKIRGFEEVLSAAGDRLDIAFFKFCFVDIGAEADVDGLFARYAGAFEQLQRRFPNVTFAHVTTPLTVPLSGLKWTIKRFLGEPAWGYRQNGMREKYNDLLRTRFGTSGLVFDLARLESTRPDGTVESYRWKGKPHPSLARCYTADEGHLAEFGRRIAGRDMLVWLATVVGPKAGSTTRAGVERVAR